MTRQTTTEDEGGRGLEVLLEWVLARAAAHESCDDLEAYETEVIKVVHAIGAHLLELELARHEPEAREVLIDVTDQRHPDDRRSRAWQASRGCPGLGVRSAGPRRSA
jgi:hypothetical protein